MATAKKPKLKAKKITPAPAVKKPRTDRSAPINQRAFEILEAASASGHKKTEFASAAIIAYATKKLPGYAIPASPEEKVEARLKCLERLIFGPKWQELTESKHILAGDLIAIIQELKLEPHDVNDVTKDVSIEKANAWKKQYGKSGTGGFSRSHVITAVYARKLGLFVEFGTEEDEE